MQRVLSVLAGMVTALASVAAHAQQPYPTKPIRVVTSEVGGSQDVTARILSQGISGPLGQQVIVDNRPSGVIPGEIVAKAPPDGYTLLLYAGTFWLQPLRAKERAVRPGEGFRADHARRGLAERARRASVAAGAIGEGADRARESETGRAQLRDRARSGSSNHLAAELFKSMAGVNIMRHRLQGQRARGRRADQRPGAAHVRDRVLGRAAHEVGQAERRSRSPARSRRRWCPTCRRSPRRACRATSRRRPRASSRRRRRLRRSSTG